MESAAGRRAATLAYLVERKAAISEELRRITHDRASALETLSPGGIALMERALEFCRRGKMIRGALVGLGSRIFSGIEARGWTAAAAAMELFQAGLLIHDDIMDGDEERRGAPSIHRAYAAEAAAAGAAGADRVGESLAVCAGDACYFEGFAALARAVAANPSAAQLVRLCAEELTLVCLAQMRDVRWGACPEEPAEAEILRMYRCKTARYSFSLPLAAGAVLAGRGDALPELFALGEDLGIAFQLRDDELGIFGDPARTGKSASSDVREGKKTLFRVRLMARAGSGESPRLRAAFSREAPESEIAFVRRRIEELGIRAELEIEARAIADRARARIAVLDAEGADLLEGLLDYATARES